VPLVLAALLAGGWLADGALVVCEYDRTHAAPPDIQGPWDREATRTYGQTGVDFLRWTGPGTR
jgi:16S rRNA G966 N2-methylase RsmD